MINITPDTCLYHTQTVCPETGQSAWHRQAKNTTTTTCGAFMRNCQPAPPQPSSMCAVAASPWPWRPVSSRPVLPPCWQPMSASP